MQSKIAIGSGGIFGKGFLSGSQSRLDFLPEKHTDFVFTLISEEMGFVGSMLFFDLGALLAPSWRHLASILEGSGLHFGGFWNPFFHIIVRFGEAFVRTVLASFSKPFRINSGWG